jgi:hypothetical protein
VEGADGQANAGVGNGSDLRKMARRATCGAHLGLRVGRGSGSIRTAVGILLYPIRAASRGRRFHLRCPGLAFGAEEVDISVSLLLGDEVIVCEHSDGLGTARVGFAQAPERDGADVSQASPQFGIRDEAFFGFDGLRVGLYGSVAHGGATPLCS